MATLILLGLIALMVITIVVMLLMRKGWKKILLTFAGFLVVLILFNLYVNKTCGPNAKDVEIMTPQAEAISDYILKNGIPESLGEIPGLPYALEDCKKATDGTNVENCYFKTDLGTLNIELYILENSSYFDIYNSQTETGIIFGFRKKNDIWANRKNITPYSGKNDGICNPLRQ